MIKITFPDGSVANVDYPITLAPDDNRYGYLYCFMNSNKEITNYALGTKEDLGKRFHVLLGGGEKGNAPLVMTNNGTPYRGFLEGRINGDSFCLLLHLTNLELKGF